MYVDVDVGRVDFDIKEIARKAVLRNHLQIGVFDGMMQIGMLDKTLIHKEILLTARLLGILRLDNITMDTHAIGLLVDGQ